MIATNWLHFGMAQAPAQRIQFRSLQKTASWKKSSKIKIRTKASYFNLDNFYAPYILHIWITANET